MTTVTLFKQCNEIYGFRVEGHSMYASNGQDIICSAISATSQMAINGAYCYEVHDAKEVMSFRQEEDKPLIEFIYDTTLKGKRFSSMLRAFEDFITELSEQYSENIRIVINDREDVKL